MTKWETSRDTRRKGTWSRDVWQKFPSLNIGFECWLLDIETSPGGNAFSDGIQLQKRPPRSIHA